METRFGENLPDLCGPVVSDLKAAGKKSMEWDLNDWKWDGDLFVAAPAPQNPVPSSHFFSVPVGSDIPTFKPGASSLGEGREERDLEKRRRYIEVNQESNGDAEVDSLNLKLGGQMFAVVEREREREKEYETERENENEREREREREAEKTGKKTKVSGVPSCRAVCQVVDCKSDLSNAKDYHRRHKVCEVHSKSTRALVGNIMQRFCQQCSRFHVLQEFDEGKRSCRRRLAGHNKRRRKTHPESAVNSVAMNTEQDSNYLLISLLRILTNIHSSGSDQTNDQNLLSHLLRNLASLAGGSNEINPSGNLPPSHDLPKTGTSLGTTMKDSDRPAGPALTIDSSSLTQKDAATDNNKDRVAQNASASQQSALLFPEKASGLVKVNASDSTAGRAKLKNIDLNYVYDGSQDGMEDHMDEVAQENGNGSIVVPSWLCKDSLQSSPPPNSGYSGSTPSQSPSASSGEAQSRTDRIVFKLFGKDPNEFPVVLRKQILDWLSSSPMDIESYIRPGCVVLTIYACMDGSTWEELYYNLNSGLRRLLDSSNDSFWRTGWIYARVQHHATFAYNGRVVLSVLLPPQIHRCCRISSITPLAVCFSETARFVVKGFNISHSTSRLFCALEGKYLLQETDISRADSFVEHEEIECLSFSCAIPNVVGRGFIEIEDHGLSSSFFPFIVAEKDVCMEICQLESIISASEVAVEEDGSMVEAGKHALKFVHEMGWLLHKSSLMSRLGEMRVDVVDLFPIKRFRWLVEFAIDHDWAAVVRKLLDILWEGTVDAGEYTSTPVALQDIGPLHQAVRRNNRAMVEALLEYHPNRDLDTTGPKQKQSGESWYLLRPDSVGPGGLTPLHVAATQEGCENVVDALTEDPGLVGIEAWKNAQDSMGLTPHDYACMRGHYSYIQLVQGKAKKQRSGNGQVVVDIPNQKTAVNGDGKSMVFRTEKASVGVQCRQCEEKLAYRRLGGRACVSIYRPAMLSMVAIAAVCVCAALLFKSSPEVLHSCRPFRWDLLKYGSE